MATLITGGAGYIGQKLAAQLIGRGETIVLLDVQAPREPLEGAQFVRGDVSVFSDVLDAVRTHDVTRIFHLGSLLSARTEQTPFASFAVNVGGTQNVLEAARIFSVERVVFSSSIGTYGELDYPEINDDTLQRPQTLYGCQKLFGEGLGRWYRRRFALDFRAIRYPQVISAGIRTPWHWAPEMMEDALQNRPHNSTYAAPDSRNIMLSMRDTLRSTLELMDAPPEAIKTVCYNVTGLQNQLFAVEVADFLREKWGAKIELLAGNAPVEATRQRFNDSKARQEWNWAPADDSLGKIVAQVREELGA